LEEEKDKDEEEDDDDRELTVAVRAAGVEAEKLCELLLRRTTAGMPSWLGAMDEFQLACAAERAGSPEALRVAEAE